MCLEIIDMCKGLSSLSCKLDIMSKHGELQNHDETVNM